MLEGIQKRVLNFNVNLDVGVNPDVLISEDMQFSHEKYLEQHDVQVNFAILIYIASAVNIKVQAILLMTAIDLLQFGLHQVNQVQNVWLRQNWYFNYFLERIVIKSLFSDGVCLSKST